MADSDRLDGRTLRRLRRVAQAMQEQGEAGVPMSELVELASDVEVDGGVTIDLGAADELGQPLVVLRVPAQRQPPPEFAALSKREWQVARLVAEGLRNKQIAARLHISLATVKDHVHRILEKTGLSSRTEVIAALR